MRRSWRKRLSHAGAAALSVLTEGEFFNGSLKNLRDARKAATVPVLRKDLSSTLAGVGSARQ